MLQPDFGTTFVLLCTALGMMFLGGAALWQFGVLIVVAGAALVGLVITSPYRLQRVVAFLDPWSDPLGSGYQLSQALIALGRGEWPASASATASRSSSTCRRRTPTSSWR